MATASSLHERRFVLRKGKRAQIDLEKLGGGGYFSPSCRTKLSVDHCARSRNPTRNRISEIHAGTRDAFSAYLTELCPSRKLTPCERVCRKIFLARIYIYICRRRRRRSCYYTCSYRRINYFDKRYASDSDFFTRGKRLLLHSKIYIYIYIHTCASFYYVKLTRTYDGNLIIYIHIYFL